MYRLFIPLVNGARSAVARLRRAPLIRFVVLGLALWLGVSYVEWKRSYEVEPPAPAQLEISYLDWARRTGTFPDEQQKAGIFQTELEDRVLFKEAIRREMYVGDAVVRQRLLKNVEFLGVEGSDTEKIDTALTLQLHLSDAVIRRHLVQKMKERVRARIHPLPPLSDDLLQARYMAARDRWRVAPSLAIEHVFFSADSADLAGRLAKAGGQLNAPSAPDEAAYSLGDAFLLGNRLPEMALPKLRNIFGEEFAGAMQEALQTNAVSPGSTAWFGPVRSAYGAHFVRVLSFQRATYRDVEAVRETLTGDYARELENEALKHYLAGLLDRYTVKEL